MALSSPIHGIVPQIPNIDTCTCTCMSHLYLSSNPYPNPVIRKPVTGTCTQGYTDQISGLSNDFPELSVGLCVPAGFFYLSVDCKARCTNYHIQYGYYKVFSNNCNRDL